jgi:hypothetical protein
LVRLVILGIFVLITLIKMISVHPSFITDINGKKISAVISMEEFNSILEQLEDLEDIRLYDASKKDDDQLFSKDDAIKMIEDERKKLS